MKTSLHFDTHVRPSAVGDQLRELLAGEAGVVRAAIAYVSGKKSRTVALLRDRASKLKLTCDPFTGGCDPALLEQLHRAGASVGCLAGLHAKVFIGSGWILVGSANVSEPALEEGNIEAGVVLRDDALVQEAREWFDALAGRAVPFATLRADPLLWAQVEAAWRARARKEGPGRPHLRDTLHLEGTTLLDRVIFSIWTVPMTAEDERTAKDAARSVDLKLSRDWDYEIVDHVDSAQVARLNRLSRGKTIIYFRAREGDSGLDCFRSLDGTAWQIENHVAFGKQVYGFERRVPSPVRLTGRESKLLVRELNEGLKRRPAIARSINLNDFVTPGTLRRLLK